MALLTAATLAGHLTVFVVLSVSLRAVGVTHTEVTIVEALAAWTLARILGAIPITPGGVGFVELGLTGVLVAFGASNAEAVAGTMIYRLLTVVPTVLLGLVAAGASVVGRKRARRRAKPAQKHPAASRLDDTAARRRRGQWLEAHRTRLRAVQLRGKDDDEQQVGTADDRVGVEEGEGRSPYRKFRPEGILAVAFARRCSSGRTSAWECSSGSWGCTRSYAGAGIGFMTSANQ